MSAAIVPLVESIGPEIISLIASLVHKGAPIAQAAKGPGTGPVKFADVFVSVMADLTRAHAQGQIAALPDDATAKLIIQSVVTSMKISGLLTGPAPDAPAAPSQLLAPGTYVVR